MFFCSYQGKQTLLCTFQYAGHTKAQQQAVIDPPAAALRAHWDSALIDYFTINSSWLLAGETSWGAWRCSATATMHWVSHTDHNVHKIYKMQPVAVLKHLLSLSLSLSLTHTHTQNTLYNVQMHTHTDCNVDNLSNEGWQVAAVWKLSSVGLFGLAHGAVRYGFHCRNNYKCVNAVFHLNFPFPQFSLAPSTRKASHYLLTPYLNTPSQERKNQLFILYECALNHPLFSISMYGAAV